MLPYNKTVQKMINIDDVVKGMKMLKVIKDSKVFIEYSDKMDDIYKNIEEYNPNKKRKILIVFKICLITKNSIR